MAYKSKDWAIGLSIFIGASLIFGSLNAGFLVIMLIIFFGLLVPVLITEDNYKKEILCQARLTFSSIPHFSQWSLLLRCRRTYIVVILGLFAISVPGFFLKFVPSIENELTEIVFIVIMILLEGILISSFYYNLGLIKYTVIISNLLRDLDVIIKEKTLDSDDVRLRIWWAQCALGLRTLDQPNKEFSLVFLNLPKPWQANIKVSTLIKIYMKFLRSIDIPGLSSNYSRFRKLGLTEDIISYTYDYLETTKRILRIQKNHKGNNRCERKK